jgi:hypothetical protein
MGSATSLGIGSVVTNQAHEQFVVEALHCMRDASCLGNVR